MANYKTISNQSLVQRLLSIGVIIITMVLAFSGFTACTKENTGLSWNDIPIYPQAELELTRNWTVLPEEEQLSEVEWRYYLAGDKYSVNDISLFYESDMPDNGWQSLSGFQEGEMLDVLLSYIQKINYYVPVEVADRMSSWGYYSKENGKKWAAIWMGANNDWEDADKTYIVIMLAR
jgi:hypothetical protein